MLELSLVEHVHENVLGNLATLFVVIKTLEEIFTKESVRWHGQGYQGGN